MVGQEWIDSDCDSYHHEDNEDEVMNNDTLKYTDEEEEEAGIKATPAVHHLTFFARPIRQRCWRESRTWPVKP